MGWKTIVGLILLGITVKKVWYFCTILQPWKVVYNHSPGPCHLVSPIANGSEDIQLLPNGKAFISSGLKLPGFSRNPRVMNSPGQFYIFDFNSPQEGAQVVPCNNFPDYGTKNFAPHGISILDNDGEVLVFVVNHPPGGNFEKDTIEKFQFDMEKNTVEHIKTYSGDYLRLVNDVVAVGPESFYATNWFYSRTKRMQQLESLVLQLDWSTLVYYDKGKARVAADGFMMGNGANISPDGRYIYVATLGTFDVKVYERKQDGRLDFVQSKQLPTMSCDNLDVDRTSGDIWVTCHAVRYYTIKYLEEPDEHRPLSPAQILRIKTKDGLLTDDVTEVYANDGSAIGASSVAVFHKDTSAMLIGSIERNMLYCEVKTLS